MLATSVWVRTGGLVLAVVLCAAPAAGQLQFVPLDPNAGLLHSGPYGTTFPPTPGHPYIGPTVMTGMQRNMGNGAALGDIDGDGDEDIYLLGQYGSSNVLLRNDSTPGSWHFTDITVASGLSFDGLSRAAYFCDLDNDGWQDLVLLNDSKAGAGYPTSRIFRNDRGVFTDVTDGSGFAPVGHLKGGICLGDYDQDGLLDMYVTTWPLFVIVGPPAFEGESRLYRNLGGFRFTDATTAAGLPVLERDCFSCVFADFDADGDADLYVAVDHSSDAYFRNENGTFVDDTIAVGATHTGNDMGLAVADFDRDGDLDIYSTNITDPTGLFGTSQNNTLLVNQLVETSTFSLVDEAVARGMNDTAWGWGTEFFDPDNDGDLDLFVVNGFDEWVTLTVGPNHPLVDAPAVLFAQDAAGGFSATVGTGAEMAGDMRAAIADDLDHDGRQDLLITAVDQATLLLVNASPNAGHWLTIDPVGGGSMNADAIGARVSVTVGAETQMVEIIAGGSYLSGRPHVAHFGLGSATSADEVRVQWPDGSLLVLPNVAADRGLRVHNLPGDGDLNGVVDLRDVLLLQRCAGGGSEPLTTCTAFDLDRDGLSDVGDWMSFLASY